MAQPASASNRDGATVGTYNDRKTGRKTKIWPWVVGLLVLIAVIALIWWLTTANQTSPAGVTPAQDAPAAAPVDQTPVTDPVGWIRPERAAGAFGAAA